jgi:hypothetical protein
MKRAIFVIGSNTTADDPWGTNPETRMQAMQQCILDLANTGEVSDWEFSVLSVSYDIVSLCGFTTPELAAAASLGATVRGAVLAWYESYYYGFLSIKSLVLAETEACEPTYVFWQMSDGNNNTGFPGSGIGDYAGEYADLIEQRPLFQQHLIRTPDQVNYALAYQQSVHDVNTKAEMYAAIYETMFVPGSVVDTDEPGIDRRPSRIQTSGLINGRAEEVVLLDGGKDTWTPTCLWLNPNEDLEVIAEGVLEVDGGNAFPEGYYALDTDVLRKPIPYTGHDPRFAETQAVAIGRNSIAPQVRPLSLAITVAAEGVTPPADGSISMALQGDRETRIGYEDTEGGGRVWLCFNNDIGEGSGTFGDIVVGLKAVPRVAAWKDSEGLQESGYELTAPLAEPTPDESQMVTPGQRRFYATITSKSGRLTYPLSPRQVSSAEWSLEENGGYGQFSLSLLPNGSVEDWLDPDEVEPFSRVEMFVDGVCRYRGFSTRPAVTLGDPVRYEISGFGLSAVAGITVSKSNLVYASTRDVSDIMGDLISQRLDALWPGLQRSLQPTGVNKERFESKGKRFQEAADELSSSTGGDMIWGFYHTETDAYTDSTDIEIKWHHKRPNQIRSGLKTNLALPDHAFVVPSSGVSGSSGDRDYMRIENYAHFTGGNPANPNLIPNGQFDAPIKAGSGNANLFLNGDFEEGGGTPTSWYGYQHVRKTASGDAGSPFSGDAFLELDFNDGFTGSGVSSTNSAYPNIQALPCADQFGQKRTGIQPQITPGKAHTLAMRYRNESGGAPKAILVVFYWIGGPGLGTEIPNTRFEEIIYTTTDGLPTGDTASPGVSNWTYKEWPVRPPLSSEIGGTFVSGFSFFCCLIGNTGAITPDYTYSTIAAMQAAVNGILPAKIAFCTADGHYYQVVQRTLTTREWVRYNPNSQTFLDNQGVLYDLVELYDNSAMTQDGWEVRYGGTSSPYLVNWMYPDSYDETGYCVYLDVNSADNDTNSAYLQMKGQAKYTINQGESMGGMVWLKNPVNSPSPKMFLTIRGFKDDGSRIADTITTIAAGAVPYDGKWHGFRVIRAGTNEEKSQTLWLNFRGSGKILADCMGARNSVETKFVPSGPLQMVVGSDGRRGDRFWGNPPYWKGVYASATTYHLDEYVWFAGGIYRALTNTTGVDPTDLSIWWEYVEDSLPYQAVGYTADRIVAIGDSIQSYGERDALLNQSSVTTEADAFNYLARRFNTTATPEESPRISLTDPVEQFFPGQAVILNGSFTKHLKSTRLHIARVQEFWRDGVFSVSMDLAKIWRDQAGWFIELLERRVKKQGTASSSPGAGTANSTLGSGGSSSGAGVYWGTGPRSDSDATLHDAYLPANGPHVTVGERAQWNADATEIANARNSAVKATVYGSLDARLEAIEVEAAAQSVLLTAIDGRLDNEEALSASFDSRLDAHDEELADHEVRIDALEIDLTDAGKTYIATNGLAEDPTVIFNDAVVVTVEVD